MVKIAHDNDASRQVNGSAASANRSRLGRDLVRSGTGLVARRSILGCVRGFTLRARVGSSVAPSRAPAASPAACRFPALRAPAHFTSRVMRPIGSERLSPTAASRRPSTHGRVPASRRAICYSTASIPILGVERIAPGAAGFSSPPKQCRPLLALRRPQRHSSSPTTPDTTELKPKKSEVLSLRQIHLPALLLVHLDIELGKLLT
jgi:hypothetical protein